MYVVKQKTRGFMRPGGYAAQCNESRQTADHYVSRGKPAGYAAHSGSLCCVIDRKGNLQIMPV